MNFMGSWPQKMGYMQLERAVRKNEKLETFKIEMKLERMKLESLSRSWKSFDYLTLR